jgi:hypothetical protein
MWLDFTTTTDSANQSDIMTEKRGTSLAPMVMLGTSKDLGWNTNDDIYFLCFIYAWECKLFTGPLGSTHPATFVTTPCVYFLLVSVDKIHCEIISVLRCRMFREGQLEKYLGLIGRNLGSAIRLAQ